MPVEKKNTSFVKIKICIKKKFQKDSSLLQVYCSVLAIIHFTYNNTVLTTATENHTLIIKLQFKSLLNRGFFQAVTLLTDAPGQRATKSH